MLQLSVIVYFTFRILYWEVVLEINNATIKNYVHNTTNTISHEMHNPFLLEVVVIYSGMPLENVEVSLSTKRSRYLPRYKFKQTLLLRCLLSLPLLSTNPVFISICKRLFCSSFFCVFWDKQLRKWITDMTTMINLQICWAEVGALITGLVKT